jgi:transposase-like protein
MADQAEQVSTTGLVDTKRRGETQRRQYSEALKRQMVAETQAPGASVSIVARRHDVNSNRPERHTRQAQTRAGARAFTAAKGICSAASQGTPARLSDARIWPAVKPMQIFENRPSVATGAILAWVGSFLVDRRRVS